MSNFIYRKVALDRLASPEQLDQLFKVTSRKAWLILLSLTSLCGLILCWGLFGEITLKSAAAGIISSSSGIILCEASNDGRIVSVKVNPGDPVKKGQTAALSETDNGDSVRTDSILVPEDGRVIEIFIRNGSPLKRGEPVFALEPSAHSSAPAQAILYIPYDGKKIKTGMEVLVLPAGFRSAEYGFILGEVTFVSDYISSEKALLLTLRDQRLVDSFLKDGPVLEVQVNLIRDPLTFSGYKWSLIKGPREAVRSGTLCNAFIIENTIAPYLLLFPKKPQQEK